MSKLNPYFNNYDYGQEQRLLEDLCIESIKQYGVDIKYIPRNIENIDYLFGEDTLANFDQFAEIEVYVKNAEGYEGEGRFLSKFGFEVRESLELLVSNRRFKQIKSNKLYTENNYLILKEDSDETKPESFSSLILEDGNINQFSINYDKPRIGDLIYFPMGNKFFEIKFVKDYNETFYQLGKIPFYSLQCEIFEYSHETFATNDLNIDNLNIFSGDTDKFNLTDESGNNILKEDGGNIIIEDYAPEKSNKSANNSLLYNESDSIIDFSEDNPFVNKNGDNRW